LHRVDAALAVFMLSAAALDVTYGDDDWVAPPAKLYRAASVGNSWGVTSIGRGFNWGQKKDCVEASSPDKDISNQAKEDTDDSYFPPQMPALPNSELNSPITSLSIKPPALRSTSLSLLPLAGPTVDIPPFVNSPSASPRLTPSSSHANLSGIPRSPIPRSPTSPYPRRRSSQRVSLIGGQVSIAPMEPPSPPPLLAPSLQRAGSTGSFLSVAVSTGPPSPCPEREPFLCGRNILEFSIESEIGRGAYGLVKRAREIQEDGSLGVRYTAS
jgi:protein-serine/threonine kinase